MSEVLITRRGGSDFKSTIIVSIETGSTVGIYDSTYTTLIRSTIEKSSGQYWCTGLDNGTYYLKATKNGQTTTMSYTISEYGVYRIAMAYTTVPAFSYVGGDYEIVEDDDTAIADPSSYQGNWKIRFLSSGTLNFTRLGSAQNGIDVFLVGGGGGSGSLSIAGGGGGGYTASYGGISVSTGVDYEIVVGAGGVKDASIDSSVQRTGGAGGASSAFGNSKEGGLGGVSHTSDSQSRSTKGGDGGSGGAGSHWNRAYNGGSNGADGSAAYNTDKGLGQGTSTREFYELDEDDTATLYAGGGGNHANDKFGVGGDGGGGGDGTSGSNGTDNLGGGASGFGYAGGTGIVIIRNARS